MTSALILAGHGSHISPETAATVWRHVDRLRAWGVADEVAAVFWKEPPTFHDALRLVLADDVTVVPVFTARGYFTQTVIPNEMGLAGPVTMREGRTIRYVRTLGEHPSLTELVKRRLTDWLAEQYDHNPAFDARKSVAVAIIGHSTRLNAESRKATERQAEALRSAELVAEVVAVYLDDTPAIADAYQLTSALTLVAVPYFIAEGSHVTIDIPQALGLELGITTASIQGRSLYYLPPVGADESLTETIIELARETGGSFTRTSLAAEADPWRGFPQAGAQQLIDAVVASGALDFGQLRLTPDQVCAVDLSDLHRPPLSKVSSPQALRVLVRGATGDQNFRPLPTSRDMPAGWYVPLSSPSQLPAVVETVYPGAVADWAAGQTPAWPVESLTTVITRQTGRLRALATMTAPDVNAIVQQVCHRCVRQPMWHHPTEPLDSATLPCLAPCSWWLDQALYAIETTAKQNEA